MKALVIFLIFFLSNLSLAMGLVENTSEFQKVIEALEEEISVKELQNKGFNFNATNQVGQTPLHYHVKNKHYSIKSVKKKSIIKALITNENLNAKDKYGNTPLKVALNMSIMTFNIGAIKVLLELGADAKDLDVNVKQSIFEDTPLHQFSQEGDVSLVRKLVELGAHLEAEDDRGYTPLYMAVFHEKIEVVDELIRLGADVNTKDKKGRSLLHQAVRRGSLGIIRLLLKEVLIQSLKMKKGRKLFFKLLERFLSWKKKLLRSFFK